MKDQKLFQGNLDALCGIYALANFIQRQPDFRGYDEPAGKLALEATLQAAESEGLFNTAHMMGGYDWPELGRIARRVLCDYYLDFEIEPLKALHVNDAAGLFRSISDLASDGGGAIISHSRGNHWVFAYGIEGDAVKIRDSAPTSDGGAILSKSQLRHVSTTDGLVFRKSIRLAK